MAHLFVLLVLIALQGILLKSFPGAFASEEIRLTVHFGFLLLSAYLVGEWAYRIRLPKLSGYLMAGVILGPDLLGTVTRESVASLRFVDDLALTYIALAAGLELRMEDLRREWKMLLGLTLGISLVVFPLCFGFVYVFGPRFGLLSSVSAGQKAAFAAVAATFAVARSPSSVVAIMKECRAKGSFSETVLCVTVISDIIVLILFSLFLSLCTGTRGEGSALSANLWISIPVEIFLSLFAGLLLAWGMAAFTRTVKADRIFFFLCVGFLVTRFSDAFSHAFEAHTGISLHLEPLLISMSAGFCIQNLFRQGPFYEGTIERSFLPIFVVFFAVAGTGLDCHAFLRMWPCAVLFAGIRFLGVLLACYGTLGVLGEPVRKAKLYGMGFVTQAGVSIGLAAVMLKRFPRESGGLYTLLLAVIVINQIVGPVMFKFALERSGDARNTPPPVSRA